MRLTIELNDFQRRVLGDAMRAGEGSPSELVEAAIAFDASRPLDPRWREPRPRPPARRRRVGARLDAVLAPATGRAVELRAGDRLVVEQLVDGQCVDLTVRSTATGAHFSAARTRAEHGIHPSVGDVLWSEPPEVPLLRIAADSAPGHDLCFPPCTPFEYERLTGISGHRGCHELLAGATRRWFRHDARGECNGPTGLDVLNLWLPTAVTPDGELRSWPVACRRGDAVEFEALTDVLVTLSACPDDLFGSSQYVPGPVRLLVDRVAGRDAAPIRTSRAMPTPRSALPRHALAVTVRDAHAEHLDRVRAGGWLGTSRAAVARALLFRWYEATVAQP